MHKEDVLTQLEAFIKENSDDLLLLEVLQDKVKAIFANYIPEKKTRFEDIPLGELEIKKARLIKALANPNLQHPPTHTALKNLIQKIEDRIKTLS